MNELTLANWKEHVTAVNDNDGEWSIDWEKFIQTLLDLQKEEMKKEMQDFRNSGFNELAPKPLLAEKYNERLVLAGQKPMAEAEKYSFYRGIEFGVDHLITKYKG